MYTNSEKLSPLIKNGLFGQNVLENVLEFCFFYVLEFEILEWEA